MKTRDYSDIQREIIYFLNELMAYWDIKNVIKDLQKTMITASKIQKALITSLFIIGE